MSLRPFVCVCVCHHDMLSLSPHIAVYNFARLSLLREPNAWRGASRARRLPPDSRNDTHFKIRSAPSLSMMPAR